jgi:hypothetical protein
MNKRDYTRPRMERFRPVRDITLLTRCNPFEQTIHPKRGHAVFAG